MKHLLLTAALLSPAAAQAFTPEAILQKAGPAVADQAGPGKSQYLNPFSRVQAGYEYGELGSNKHEFSLNFRPKSISEFGKYKTFSQSLQEEAGLSQKLLRSRSLALSYSLVIDAALAKEQLGLVKEWKLLLQQSQGLSALEARRSEADVKTLIKNGPEVDKAHNELIDLEALIAGTEAQLAAGNFSVIDLDISDIAGPSEIAQKVSSLPNSPGLTEAKLRSKLAVETSGFAHDASANNHLIDSIKVTAQTEKKKDPSFGFELTFNLPFLAAESLSEHKDRLKLAELEVETREKVREETIRTAGLSQQIRAKISLWQDMDKRNSAMKGGSNLGRQDPVLAFELRRANLKNRLMAAELLAEIRLLYVQLLLERGRLADEPGTNHLSKSGRKI